MDEEILKNIWNTLTNDGATKSDFETWKSNFSGSEEIQDNVHAYLTDKKYTKSDIETWRTNVGIATSEKKKSSRYSFHFKRGRYGIHYRDGNNSWIFGWFRSRS